MTKEELKHTEENFDTNISDVLKVLENCIEIPNGATNGDTCFQILKLKEQVERLNALQPKMEQVILHQIGGMHHIKLRECKGYKEPTVEEMASPRRLASMGFLFVIG